MVRQFFFFYELQTFETFYYSKVYIEVEMAIHFASSTRKKSLRTCNKERTKEEAQNLLLTKCCVIIVYLREV